jgi:hypothetical protein
VVDGGKVVGVQRRKYIPLERVREMVKKVVDDTHCESVVCGIAVLGHDKLAHPYWIRFRCSRSRPHEESIGVAFELA